MHIEQTVSVHHNHSNDSKVHTGFKEHLKVNHKREPAINESAFEVRIANRNCCFETRNFNRIMSVLFLAILFVPCVLTSASTDDEYFRKAVFRALKEGQGQFHSEMRMTRYHYGHRFQEVSTGDQEEKFSFQTNTGFYSFYGSDFFRDHNLYVNGREFYSYSENQIYCESRKYDKWTPFYHLG